jgi:hypothetical protein
MGKPKSFLLQVFVTLNADGSSSKKILSFFDGTPAANPLPVNLGDQVAWQVLVVVPNGRKALPYSLNFTDSQFFGVPSLNVPHGGTSPYLTVLVQQAKISYTLTVTGMGLVPDPDIQSGTDALFAKGELVPSIFQVTWDTVGNTMGYTQNNGQSHPLSNMKVAYGDTVNFTATALTINNNVVYDPSDAGKSFPITATISVDSVQKIFNPNADPNLGITM